MNPEPEAYLGCIMDKMPNCFLYFGPNAGPGAGNAYLCAELECAYAISFAKKMLREKIKSICVKSVIRTIYAADGICSLTLGKKGSSSTLRTPRATFKIPFLVNRLVSFLVQKSANI